MKQPWSRALFLALSGVTAALPVTFSALWPLSVVSFVPLCFLLFEELRSPVLPYRPRHYYGAGMLFLMTYFITVFHWFTYLYPLDFVSGMTPAGAVGVILSACIGLPLLQSVGFAVLFYALAWLSRTPLVRRVPLLLPFLFAALWTVFAYTQTLTWAGVPWGAQLALAQYENRVMIASASLFGSYFVTFILAAVNALLAYAALAMRERAVKAARVGAIVALALLCGNMALGGITYLLPREAGATVRAAVLQGNVASSEKWTGGDVMAVYEDLARQAADEGAVLTVWPETAVAGYLEGDRLSRVQRLAAETGSVQVVGAFSHGTRADGSSCRYNSLFVVYPDGRVDDVRYHKRHPVPFGEYVPMKDVVCTLLPFLSKLEMFGDGNTIEAGTGSEIFRTELGDFGGLICFDSIYPALSRASAADGAEALLLGTNDSWFFDSAAVYMHNGQAVLRAVENGRPVLRAANTGISSIITDRGEVLGTIAPLIEGELTADITLTDTKTLYTCIGDVFVLLCQLFVLVPPGVLLADHIRKKRKKGQ